MGREEKLVALDVVVALGVRPMGEMTPPSARLA